MFDFNSIETPHKLNRDFILSKISDSIIFGYYFGQFNLKDVYPSKFHKDRNPSTGFYVSSSGKLIYNHLNGKEPKMDAFAYVARLYNCTFKEAIHRIARDFGLVKGEKGDPMTDKVRKELARFDKGYKKDTKINFLYKPFTDEAKEYWKSFAITRDEVKREGIFQIEKLFINDIFIPNKDNNLRFALTVPFKDETRTKVYSPEGTDTLKWVSNIDNDMAFGMHNVRKGPTLIITKSMKDMIILRKFFKSVIAVQNESRSFFSNKRNLEKIKFYWPEILINFDIDETGLDAMTDIKEEFGFNPLHFPVEFMEAGIKDNGDYVKELGLKAFEKEVINDFLHKYPSLKNSLI